MKDTGGKRYSTQSHDAVYMRDTASKWLFTEFWGRALLQLHTSFNTSSTSVLNTMPAMRNGASENSLCSKYRLPTQAFFPSLQLSVIQLSQVKLQEWHWRQVSLNYATWCNMDDTGG